MRMPGRSILKNARRAGWVNVANVVVHARRDVEIRLDATKNVALLDRVSETANACGAEARYSQSQLLLVGATSHREDVDGVRGARVADMQHGTSRAFADKEHSRLQSYLRGTQDYLGFDGTVRGATIAADGVVVVALFIALDEAVATDRRSSGGWTEP